MHKQLIINNFFVCWNLFKQIRHRICLFFIPIRVNNWNQSGKNKIKRNKKSVIEWNKFYLFFFLFCVWKSQFFFLLIICYLVSAFFHHIFFIYLHATRWSRNYKIGEQIKRNLRKKKWEIEVWCVWNKLKRRNPPPGSNILIENESNRTYPRLTFTLSVFSLYNLIKIENIFQDLIKRKKLKRKNKIIRKTT